MRATGVDHLDLVVSDLERSLAFYRDLLEPLGYGSTTEIVGEQGERVVYLHASGLVAVSLREARTTGNHDRYRVGLHHLAFQAPSREAVDDRLRWARDQGVEIENDPSEYDYMPGYYAGFFRDPDGDEARGSAPPVTPPTPDTAGTWFRPCPLGTWPRRGGDEHPHQRAMPERCRSSSSSPAPCSRP